MCLYADQKKKLPRVDAEGYCIGWKVVDSDNTSPFKWVIPRVHEYKIGLNVDLGFNSSKNETGSACGYRVRSGFHICATRKDARQLAKNECFCKNPRAIQVFFKPEDVVATGSSNVNLKNKDGSVRSPKGIVVTKLTIKSLKPQ